MLITSIVAILLLAVAIYIADEVKLRRRSTIELTALLYSAQWARYNAALKELKRRSVDIAEFEPRLLSLLLSKSLVERGTAYNLISDHFPRLKEMLKEYRSTESPELSRSKLPHLFDGVAPADGYASIIVVPEDEKNA